MNEIKDKNEDRNVRNGGLKNKNGIYKNNTEKKKLPTKYTVKGMLDKNETEIVK